MAQKSGCKIDNILRRARLVVGNVIDSARMRAFDRSNDGSGDVVGVNAIEHLARLDNRPRGAA